MLLRTQRTATEECSPMSESPCSVIRCMDLRREGVGRRGVVIVAVELFVAKKKVVLRFFFSCGKSLGSTTQMCVVCCGVLCVLRVCLLPVACSCLSLVAICLAGSG